MKDLFKNILSDYTIAYGQKFGEHPLAKLIRDEIPSAISKVIIEKERYRIKGSAGAGNWSSTPWIAIFDVLITETAQSGYYPVFLFRDDMSGFYLSLNQGVTDINHKYKKDAKDVLKLKAEDFRAQLGILPSNFNKISINLNTKKTTKSKLPGLYEAGNVIAKYYSVFNIPGDQELQNDILEMLRLYELISYNEGLPSTQAQREDEENYKGIEDLKKFRFHKRIERNITLSKKVKKAQGFTCKACGINFENKYGQLGKEFIEAHHLKPISMLQGEKIQLNARNDFTVLCSNCHSMIHRLEDPSDLSGLINLIFENS